MTLDDIQWVIAGEDCIRALDLDDNLMCLVPVRSAWFLLQTCLQRSPVGFRTISYTMERGSYALPPKSYGEQRDTGEGFGDMDEGGCLRPLFDHVGHGFLGDMFGDEDGSFGTEE